VSGVAAMKRPEDLRQHVEDSLAEGEQWDTRCAWVCDVRGTTYYTCKQCARVFDGPRAFSGHCSSSYGCGLTGDDNREDVSLVSGYNLLGYQYFTFIKSPTINR